MIKNLWILLLLPLLLIFTRASAQFSGDYVQYMFNPLLLNPAYAGSQNALNATGIYRRQWVGMSASPVSAIASVHSPLRNRKLNLGAVIINDRYGIYDHTKANLIYAYRMRFFKGNLALGLQGGIDSYSTDWDKINTTEAGDPNFTPTATRKTIAMAGAGAYYNSKRFFLGLSAPDLYNERKDPFYFVNLTSGCLIQVNERFNIKPAILIKRINGSPLLTNISTTFFIAKTAGLGLGYTINNSVMAFADLRLTDNFDFGYGYSYMLNKLHAYSYGSHEIMIRYLLPYKARRKAPTGRFF